MEEAADDVQHAALESPPAKRNLWVAPAADVRVQRERLEQLVLAPEAQRPEHHHHRPEHHHAGFSGRSGALVGSLSAV